MSHFTPEQRQELETVYGLKPRDLSYLHVKDGLIYKHQQLWWKSSEGPEWVKASEHWKNIREYPQLYSHAKPPVKSVVYRED